MGNFTKGFVRENPIFSLFLGLCPSLAVTNMAINGLAMGLATTFVLVSSNVVISALRKIIPDKIRMPSYIIIIASFVTVVKLFMNASFIELYKSMGVFIALIVVNCIILGRAEAFANKNSVGKSFIDGLGIGLGFTVSITLLSVIREILGNGSITLIGGKIDLSPIIKGIGLESDGNMASMLIFILPAGGFITIGLLLGLFNKFKAKLPPLEEEGEV